MADKLKITLEDATEYVSAKKAQVQVTEKCRQNVQAFKNKLHILFCECVCM